MINKVLPAGEPAKLCVVSWSLQLVDISNIRLVTITSSDRGCLFYQADCDGSKLDFPGYPVPDQEVPGNAARSE